MLALLAPVLPDGHRGSQGSTESLPAGLGQAPPRYEGLRLAAFQSRFYGASHPCLGTGRNPAPITQIGVSFSPGSFDRDVARCAFAIARDHDEGVWPKFLSEQLVFDVGFARQ